MLNYNLSVAVCFVIKSEGSYKKFDSDLINNFVVVCIGMRHALIIVTSKRCIDIEVTNAPVVLQRPGRQ